MERPREFRHSSVLLRELPYKVLDTHPKGSQPGVGVLQPGRVLWLDRDLNQVDREKEIAAYAEGVGLIAVHPSALSRAN